MYFSGSPMFTFRIPTAENMILTVLHHIMADTRIFVDNPPLVVHIAIRSENANGDTFVVECTGDSISPRNRTARVALRALFAVLYLCM